MATNTKGATKEVGKALTRLCLRHRSVEAKLRSFTASIMEQLVIPLQDKLEDWKKSTLQLDKDHSKEFKRARQEIKKMSTDTLRLQKKVKKGSGKWEMQRSLECALQEMSDRCLLLEEAEKQAVRRALVEERARYCLLVACLTPVLEEELLMLQETSHLQEILDSLAKLTRNPECLPSASEQVITDLKGSQGTWTFQTPPGSPGPAGGSTSSSLGSRKSSMCSISSFNSSSSGSTKSHSPSHQLRCRAASQPPVGGPLRLSSVSSQDSGFTSQDTLFLRPPSPRGTNMVAQVSAGDAGMSSLPGCASSSPSSPFPTTPSVTSTWPNLQDSLQFERAMNSVLRCQRPHTISSAYERSGHQARPLLTAETFQPLEGDLLSSSNHSGSADTLTSTSGDSSDGLELAAQPAPASGARPKSPQTPTRGPRPPVPIRTSSSTSTAPSLPEKPALLKQAAVATVGASDVRPLGQVTSQPIYANADELAVAASTLPGTESPPLPPPPIQDSLQAISSWEPDGMTPMRRGSALQMHEAYKTYSPSNSSMRYEGLSGSSTLPAKSSFRRSSQPPPPPPVRRTPSITSTQGCSPSSPSSQHIQEVPSDRGCQSVGDSDDSSTSRAKLIQALNARFSKPSPLEQAGLRFSLPSSHTEDSCGLPLPDPPETSHFDPENDSKPFPAPPPFLEPVENDPLLDVEGEHAGALRKQVQPEKKLLRAHTIGHSERDALIQSLNAKFSTPEVTPPSETKMAARKTLPCESPSMACARSQRSGVGAAMKSGKSPPEMDFFRANLEQTLLKRELKRDPRTSIAGGTTDSAGENRRSRSVGPVPSGEKKNNSAERRQFLSSLNARLAEQRRASLQPAQQLAPSVKPAQYTQQMTTFCTGQTTVPVPAQYVHMTSSQIQNVQVVQAVPGTLPQTTAVTTRRGSLQPDVEFGLRKNGGRAARVQSWLAGRGSVDLTACRESLMDQIRQGTVLKRVASQSDRSTPLLL
ncbi:uncharacterized protein LOC144114049 isoform X2 [Amblyomma americanum]